MDLQMNNNQKQGGSPLPSGVGGLLPYYKEGVIEAGCDEAGRGCLAGSVYAAAVILPPDYHNGLLNDSKQLTAKQRYRLRDEIERDAVAWALGIVTAQEIDEMNILRASITAMHRAIDGLKVRPEHLIIDGNRFLPYRRPSPRPSPIMGRETIRGVGNKPDGLPIREEMSEGQRGSFIPHTTIVKGDGKYLSIAAASILAKTYRDDYMKKLHEEFPYYGWDHNAGYPTKEHRQGIELHGTTPYHRMSFNLLGTVQLELPFTE